MAKKVSTRRAWTTDHVRTLKTLARKKTTAARIAKTLKRTEGATRQKAFALGLSLDSRAWNFVAANPRTTTQAPPCAGLYCT